MSTTLKTFSKEELIARFKEIYAQGWIENYRSRNDGAVGNILEDLLGILENNLPIPNAAEWELKAQRANTASLVTLFRMEPSPRAVKIVPEVLLNKYGWLMEGAGKKYPENEMSFRSTINTQTFSDRGFKVSLNDKERKVEIAFNSTNISPKHSEWFDSVKKRTGRESGFEVTPYWGYDDLFHKAGTKLINCFYVQADEKKEFIGRRRKSFFKYNYILKLSQFSEEHFIEAIRKGLIFVDFDARTHHNHGTKFRIQHKNIPLLYQQVEVILDEREEK